MLSFLAFDLTLEIDRGSKLIRTTGVKSSINISSGRRPRLIRAETGERRELFSCVLFILF